MLLALMHTLADDAGVLFDEQLLTPSEASLGAHWGERACQGRRLGFDPWAGS